MNHAHKLSRNDAGQTPRRRAAYLAAAVLSLLAAPALAATDTWTGFMGGTCNFGANPWSVTGACWSNGGNPPANGNDVVLADTGPSFPSTYDINRTFNSITLNTPAAQTRGWTIANAGGFVLGLQNGGSITDNNTFGPDALNTGVTLNGPATFTLSAGANSLSFGAVAISGAGPLTLVNNSGDDGLSLGFANTYTGATAINGGGRVRLDANGAIPTGSALTVNGSALFLAGSTIGSLAGGGNVFMNGVNGALAVGGDNTSTTFSGVYQNYGNSIAALTKNGSGTFALSGANTYTGATTVNAGVLAVNGSLASPVSVNAGATLGGTGTIRNTVTVADGATLAPGNSPGTLTVATLVLNNASVLAFELGNPAGVAGTDSDLIQVNGDLTLDGVINVTGLAGFGAGIYRIINYTGSLSDATLTVGTLPVGYSATVNANTYGQVNLVVVVAAVPVPTINLLGASPLCELTVRPPIVDMASGVGPAFAADMTTLLTTTLLQSLSYVEQTICGAVVLSGYNGGKLAFIPHTFQPLDTRANGIHALGNGQYQVVRSGPSGGQSLSIAPALAHVEQLLALLHGVSASQANNGVLIATFNGQTYAVQPGVAVQLDPATGSAHLTMGGDGYWHFIDALGNHQTLYPAFADFAMLRNALQGLDARATLSMQPNGTVTAVVNGQHYTLVPDITLSQVPADRVGQYWWQESATRFWVTNAQPLGTAQGFTVRP